MPIAFFVNLIDHARQRRAFSASGRTRDQNHTAAAAIRQTGDHLRDIQLSRIRKTEGNQAECRRQRAALLIGVAAEARQILQRKGKIVIAFPLQRFFRMIKRHRIGFGNHLSGIRRLNTFFRQRDHVPFDLRRRRRTRNQKDIRAADFKRLLQNRCQFHVGNAPFPPSQSASSIASSLVMSRCSSLR